MRGFSFSIVEPHLPYRRHYRSRVTGHMDKTKLGMMCALGRQVCTPEYVHEIRDDELQWSGSGIMMRRYQRCP